MPELKLLVDRDLLLVDPPPPHLIGQTPQSARPHLKGATDSTLIYPWQKFRTLDDGV